jgi:hypothetical protein
MGSRRLVSVASTRTTWTRRIGSSPAACRTSAIEASTHWAEGEEDMIATSSGSITVANFGRSEERAWCKRALTAPTEMSSSEATSAWLSPCQ